MSNFFDSIAFAAMMTLYDELKQDNSKQFVTSSQSSVERELPFDSQITDKDTSNGYGRLCKIANSLFRSADVACNTVTDVSAEDILPMILCGIFYEAIKDTRISEFGKIEMFEYVVNYCRIECDDMGKMLFFEGDNPLADSISQLTVEGLSMIMTAAEKSERYEDGIGFITAMAELLNYAEESLYRKNCNFKFSKKPALIVIEKAKAFCEEQMQIMEAEDPSLKEISNHTSKSNSIDLLLNEARTFRLQGKMKLASQKYREVLAREPQNWEAVFYSEFCEIAVITPDMVRLTYIPECTDKIIRATEKSIPLSKSQLYTRIDILNGIGGIAESIIKQAEHYFVATMNLYKSIPQNSVSENDKIMRVNKLIHMLFSVGDIFEKYYCDDREICVATAYACWHIAITCYESCNMPQPIGTYDHWIKMKKYDPYCQCEKVIASSATEGISSQSTPGGCYIATSVYGTYDCPQVWTLRRFRDFKLDNTWYGRSFIRTYYAISPTLVRLFGNSRWFKNFWKSKLDRIVEKLQARGYENTEYTDKY